MDRLLQYLWEGGVEWRTRPWMKYLYIGIAVLFMLTMSGVLFGWSSLLLVLYSEGVYHELCPSNTTSIEPVGNLSHANAEPTVHTFLKPFTTCKQQEFRLSITYTTGIAVMMVVSPFTGAICDNFGSRFTLALSSFIFTCGSILFAIGHNTSQFDALIPAVSLISFACAGIWMSFQGFSKLIPEYLSAILAFLSISFDASTGVFYVYLEIYKYTGLNLTHFFLLYSIFPVASCLIAIFLWPKGIGVPAKGNDEDTKELQLESISSSGSRESEQYPIKETDPVPLDEVIPDDSKMQDQGAIGTVHLDLKEADMKPKEEPTSAFGSTHLFHLPFLQQIKSVEWISFTLYMCIYTFWLNSYFGSAQARLEGLDPTGQSADLVKSYVGYLGIILTAAFIIAPIFGYVIQKVGLEISIIILWVLAMSFSILIILPSIHLQIVSFLVFSTLRAYFYAVSFNILLNLLGWAHIGKAFGLTGIFTGPLSFAFSPLLYAVYNYWNGSFLIPSTLQIITISLTLSFWVYLRLRRKRFESGLIPTGPSSPATK